MPATSAKNATGQKAGTKQKFLAVFLILGAVIFAIVWLLRGKTVITGNDTRLINSEYITCTSNNVSYKLINLRNPVSMSARATAMSSSQLETSKISFTLTATYPNSEDTNRANNIASVSLAQSLAETGLEVSTIKYKMSVYDNKLILSFTAKLDGIDSKLAKFFMVGTSNEDGSLDLTLPNLQQNYEEQSFDCMGNI